MKNPLITKMSGLPGEYPSVDMRQVDTDFKAETQQREYLNKLVFGHPIKNGSLLHIGSSLGYFCIEALKRGAATATGIEASPERIARAREIAAFSGLPVNYICSDFEEWSAKDRSYDVVLCLNVLHHFYDPVGALRKIMRITRDRAVLEITGVTWRDIFRTPSSWATIGALRSPLILLGGREQSETAADRTFVFTKAAISKIFGTHSKSFEPLRFIPSPSKGLIVEARRRRIDHLVVIAGVACVGKSKLIERLMSSSALRARFGIGEDKLESVSAHRIDDLPSRSMGTVIFHYDILRPHSRNLWSHKRDPAFQLIGCGRKLTVITLVQKQSVIVQRSICNEQPSKRRKELAEHYKTEKFLSLWYDAWFDSISPFIRQGDASRIVVADNDYTELDRGDMHGLLDPSE